MRGKMRVCEYDASPSAALLSVTITANHEEGRQSVCVCGSLVRLAGRQAGKKETT